MEKLRQKIEEICRRIDLLRRQLAQKAHSGELSAAQYQMQITYLAHLENRAVQLLKQLQQAAPLNPQSETMHDAFLELYGEGAKNHALLPEAFKQRMLLAQKFCQTLSDILQVISRPSRLLGLLPFSWLTRRKIGRIERKVTKAFGACIKDAQRFGTASRDTLRAAPSPIAARNNLRTMVRLLREMDCRSLVHENVMAGAAAGSPPIIEDKA